MKQKGSTIHGVGRRKRSVARVWLKKGSGSITVNGKDYTSYFDTKMMNDIVTTSLKVAELDKSFDVNVNVFGGGKKGQAEAIRLGTARAVLVSDEALRPLLKKNGLLTVDARNKERKKFGQKGARKKFQFTKR